MKIIGLQNKTICRYAFFVWSLIFVLLISSITEADDKWQSLFNGKNLKGWVRLNGEAEYYVDNGDIVGETVLGSPNSFLCTRENYKDFILEFEVMLKAPINSGVQIRSESRKDYRNGRVFGYQVEIDPSERKWTGGIYDEARRGWLYNLERNDKGRTAFRMGKWNRFRIEAVGNSIRTWVNGRQCAYLVDEMTSEGFIGLQVHNIRNKEQEGKKIRWRNIRIMTENLEPNRIIPDPEAAEISYLENQLTAWEEQKGWKLLWDGKTTKGWRGAKLKHFPENGWEIKDGILSVLESGGGESLHGGDIITDRTYSNFILKVDFRISKGANSGIKYFVDPDLNKGKGSAVGCEFQILDDKRHPDAKKGIDGNRTLGSLYDLITAKSYDRVPGNKRFNGIGQWNRARIVVRDCNVEHWLNNEKVVAYERCSQRWKALVASSKYKDWPVFGEAKDGYILLQDHGNKVSFKNIKILELEE